MELSKKIICINDLSGIGRCSLMVAIPILSVMGIQSVAVPTALLSAHTGFPNYSFFDFTDNMPDYLNNLSKLNMEFDMIYSGFLGGDRQIEIVLDFVKSHKNPKFLCDPVMGDNGEIYGTYTAKMCSEMKELVKNADIITPNITEACILLDIKYPGENICLDKAKDMAKKLSKQGPEIVILTGIKPDNKNIINFAYLKNEDKFIVYKSLKSKTDYPGTGDIFASIIAGCLVKDISLENALKTASDFIKEASDITSLTPSPKYCGIMFEKILYKLSGELL